MKYLAREGTERGCPIEELDYRSTPHVRSGRDGIARIRP